MDKIKTLLDDPTLQQIIKDSFGGVMYNVANRPKYDTTELMEKWNALNPSEQSSVGGVVNGAINFINE